MLSVAINIKNGEQHIARCLNALSKFEDVVILDNYSTDKTVEIAKTYPNVRLFEHEFLGMGKVRNILAKHAKYDWIFFVDCDEVVNPKLVNKLLSFNFTDKTVYQLFRQNFYANYFVDSSSWGNDWVTRVYNRKQTQYSEADVHESVNTTGMTVEKINDGYIYHFPYDNISQLIDKMQFYSSLYAKQNFGKKKPKLYSIPFRAFIMFFKCYILKRGFMQGFEGLAISSYNAMGVFSKYIKLYELGYKRKLAIAFKIDFDDENILLSLLQSINEQTQLPEKAIFVLADNVFTEDFQIKLEHFIRHNLVVPAVVVGMKDSTVSSALRNILDKDEVLNNIIYPSSAKFLENRHFFKQCKTAVVNGTKILKTDIYVK